DTMRASFGSLVAFLTVPATTAVHTLSLHDALPISQRLVELGIPAERLLPLIQCRAREPLAGLVSGSLDVDKLDYQTGEGLAGPRSEEHTSELQSRGHLVCRLLLEKKKTLVMEATHA